MLHGGGEKLLEAKVLLSKINSCYPSFITENKVLESKLEVSFIYGNYFFQRQNGKTLCQHLKNSNQN